MGFLLILLPYAVYVLLAVRHPEVDFFAQMRGRNSMIREHIGDTLKGEIRRWNQFFQWPQGAPLAGMMLGGWAIAMAKSTRGDKILATIITLFAIAMPFASVNSTSRYLTGTIPLFSGLVLRLLDRIIGVNPSPGSPRKKGRLFASVGMGAGYAITCVTGISLMIYRHREADLDPLLDRVAEVTQSKGPVYGEMLLWMGQGRVDYGPYPIDEPWGDSGLELLLPYRFRYAVRTAWRFGTSHGLSAPPREMPPWRPDYLVDQLCLHHGTKIAAFRDPHFGPAEIYRLEFDECPSPASAPTAP